MKKTLLFITAFLFMAAISVSRTIAGDNGKTVTLRIEGRSETYFYGKITTDAQNVYGLLKEISDGDNNISVYIEEGSYGNYITGINGDMAGSIEPMFYDGWMYLINDVSSMVGIDEQEIKDGDSIVFYYSDEFGSHGFAVPRIDLSQIEAGIICFTSDGYDKDYNPVVLPVNEAEVIWDESRYITDKEGKIILDKKDLTVGEHTLKISKVSDDGMPLVLRYPSDYTVSLSAKDIENGDAAAGDNFSAIACLLIMGITAVFIIFNGKRISIYVRQ